MKLFIDTANLDEIEEALSSGFIYGITTNPSLLAKEPKGVYLDHMAKIVALANKYGGEYSLSIEVFSDEPKEMIEQAKDFVEKLKYPHLAIKIHISHGQENKLAVVHELARLGITVNCTACMTSLQAMAAAAAGAKYVSFFYNRLRDGGTEKKFSKEREEKLKNGALETTDFDPDQVIRDARELIAPYEGVEIISGSIRTVKDIKHAGLAGSHIVTASLKVIKEALGHYKTDEAVGQFFNDFKTWIA